MFGIFITVCLLNNPEQCKPITLTFSEEQPHMGICGAQAMAEIAKWMEAHPGYYLQRWSCAPIKDEKET